MSIDEIVTRHRPADRLSGPERAALLAGFDRLDAPEPGPAADVIALIDAPGRPSRPRRIWLPAVAAATVLIAAAGLEAWRFAGGRNRDAPSGGDVAVTCAGTLPASWDAARLTTPVQVDGHDAVPQAATPEGAEILSWDATPTTVSYALRAADGTTTPVATFPASNSGPRVFGTDGRRVVFGLSSDGRAIDDVVLVDARTGRRRHLIPGAPMPAGWVVTTDVAIFGGDVYWGATPSATDDSRGIVIRYSLGDGTYRVLARLDRFPTVLADVRGVAWPTGSVRRKGLPAVLNPLLDPAGNPVDRLVTDGRTYAWQLIDGDQTVFHWADAAGNTRTFRVAIDREHDGAGLSAVSGPFVFFHVNKRSGTESVLDTRTGALARSDRDEEVLSAPGQHLYSMAGAFEYHEIATTALRGFGCS